MQSSQAQFTMTKCLTCLNARGFLHHPPVRTSGWGGRKKGRFLHLQRGCFFPAFLHLTSFRKSQERMLLTPMLSLFLLKSLTGWFSARSAPWLSVCSHKCSNRWPGHADTAAEVANVGKHWHLVPKKVQIKTTGQGSKPKFEVAPAFGQALS